MASDGDRDRDSLDEVFRTFEDDRGSDQDGDASVRVPAPHKPDPDDSAIALPESESGNHDD
jgi:hypothetical protein